MANRSPDEGVRAALIPVVWETHPLAYNHIQAKTGLGTYRIVGRNDGTAVWGTSEIKRLVNEAASIDDAKAQAEADYETRATACFAALSTPVPEEGLPRGSASAAKGGAQDQSASPDEMTELYRLRAYIHTLEIEVDDLKSLDAHAEWQRLDRVVGDLEEDLEAAQAVLAERDEEIERLQEAALSSAEAGDGVASALSSPLPSQGEPVAWAISLEDCPEFGESLTRSKAAAEWHLKEGYKVTPLYTAEALSAEAAGTIAAARKPEWMPIDSAPKDGATVLLACADWPHSTLLGKPVPMKVGGWNATANYWQVFGASWRPTHWMPLPAPPLPPSSSPEDQEKAKAAATPTIADPDGEARS